MSGAPGGAESTGKAAEVARIYDEHADALLRYGIRLCGNYDEASDALHEAFVRLMGLPSSPESPRSWLFKVMTNVVRDTARSRTRWKKRLNNVDPAYTSPSDPLSDLEAAEIASRIRAALAVLREKERIAVLMREEGFTHREIAAVLGTTTGTIGTLLARAFEKLARSLPLEGP